MSGTPGPIEKRFWPKVKPAGALDCWIWGASLNDAGYGQIHLDGRPQRAHRIAWQLLRGEIPEDLQLDHLCRVRSCVNPWHLEPVTSQVNTDRGILGSMRHPLKSHCRSGHEFTERNTVTRSGYRACVTCERRNSLSGYYRRKARTA